MSSPMWCDGCRAVGAIHCAHPDECGNMLSATAAADQWKAWLDDLPLPFTFDPAIGRLQDFITALTTLIDVPQPASPAEAERDTLAAANAALEAKVGARRAERDQLRAAVEGLIAVLDRNGEKGPIPDVEMMFCWLAAQNVRAAFRNTEGRGDMTDDEALETLFAMANVQDGYAKKATDRGLKIIHKANAKAQREVAATINDLRARLASAEAERDRLAAANAVLEAKVAGLVDALRKHHEWHLSQDRDGNAWGIDPVDAYSESGLCEETCAALATQEAGNA